MWQSFQSGNLRSLDYRFWQSLESPISKRLYRLLDKRFYKREAITFDLHCLAFEKVGLSRNMHTGQIKEKLKPAHEELKDKGVCDAKYVKRARGAWDVIYEDVRQTKGRLDGVSSNTDMAVSTLEVLLSDRGIANAKELVAKYDEKRIREAIENFDDRKMHGEDIGAGWLGKAIVHPEGFSFRKGYESKRPSALNCSKKTSSKPGEIDLRKETEVHASQDAVKRRRRSEFLEQIAHYSSDERDALETEGIRRAHAAGNRFIADHVQRLRREGGALEVAGAIRQQLWWEYILGEVEALKALKAV